VRLESLVALIAGGVAFDTPRSSPKAEPATANAVFTLYSDQATAMKQPESIARHYVLSISTSRSVDCRSARPSCCSGCPAARLPTSDSTSTPPP
jgi:hypothetical protein